MTDHRWRFGLVVAGLLGSALAVPAAEAAPVAVAVPGGAPHIGDEGTVPVYSYADAVRETVWVDSPVDYDRDGRPDRVIVDVIRPREAAEAGVKVPVIMDVSPYYRWAGRGNEHEPKEVGPDGRPSRFPLYYDNYFVPRGYAVALVDSAGNGGSHGCIDVTGPSETAATLAVVDWLNGRAPATSPHDGQPAVATAWATGKVGLIGKSYDGGLALAAAARGAPEIATVVPISAPTDYYDLWRPGGAMGVGSIGPAFPPACAPYVAELEQQADFVTGNYNDFWAERDFVSHVDDFRASVFVVAGSNDWVVPGAQFARLWAQLERHDVPRKLWLSSIGHVDPFDFRRAEWVPTLHRWFDQWLQGIDTGIMRDKAVSVEVTPDVWVDQRRWPARGSAQRLHLGEGTLRRHGAGRLGRTATVVDDPALAEEVAVADPATPRAGRLVFQTEPLTRATRVSGVPTVVLRVKADKPTTMITARLVEYGPGSGFGINDPDGGITTGTTETCWGESIATDDACYFETAKEPWTADANVMARGYIDAAHRDSLTAPSPLRPDRWNKVTIRLDGHDHVVPAGHRLALVLTLTDPTFEAPPPTGATLTIDLPRSHLMLPTARPPH